MTSKSIEISRRLSSIGGLSENLLIPERTRSLLWITDQPPDTADNTVGYSPITGEAVYASQVSGFKPLPYGDKIPFLLSGDGSKIPVSEFGVQKYIENNENLYAEPSLIWTRLLVTPNSNKLPSKPYYYPRYEGLSPEGRFQYLNWLTDITQPTYLSYVFLYFYGLERHLVYGDYDTAIDEIKLLLKHHDIGGYAYNDLALASIIRGQNILDKLPDIEGHMFNPAGLRAYYKMTLSPQVVLRYATQAGFTNTRYIKQRPDLFNENLQKAIDVLEARLGGPFFSKFTLSGYADSRLINESLRDNSENIQIPSAQQDDEFEKIIYSLLDRAHTNVRLALHPDAIIKKSDKTIMNSARKRELYEEIDAAISNLLTKYKRSMHVEADKSDILPIAKCIARLESINIQAKLNPDLAITSANDLINYGYRAPAAFSALARAYLRKNDYRAALDTLMQATVDYGYNFKWELRSIIDRFRSELDITKKPSPGTERLNILIEKLVSGRNKSPWAGIDKSLELTLGARRRLDEKVSKIWRLGKTEPQKSLEKALDLFSEGYRTELICRCIAASYRRQAEYRKEIDFLVQLKKDFEHYDFDTTLRQALRLAEKSKDPPSND